MSLCLPIISLLKVSNQKESDVSRVSIEIQDQFGRWHTYTNVSDNPNTIRQWLNTALNQQLAKKSRKVRAVDESGNLIDLLQG